MSRAHAISALVGLLAFAGTAHSHEVRPCYFELRQTGPERYDLTWKVPMRGNLRLGIYPRLPEGCVATKPPVTYVAQGALIERQTITCPGGLAGHIIAMDGLSGTMTDVLVRLERSDGTTQVARLSPSNPSFVVVVSPSRIQVAATYTRLGIEHILLGVDHLLFVACLLLIAGTGRRLLITITGFTLAHSVTLALSALQLVRLPVPPVEAAIALSILFLAVEIARGRENSLTFRYPIAVSSSFGLVHGFGFAAVLREIGLPQNEIPTALLCFNVGVEIGQILFVIGVLALLHSLGRIASRTADRPVLTAISRARMPATYLIGSVASYWLIARLDVFFQS